MGVATIVPTAISPIEYTRQSLWRILVLGTFVCKWIQGQIITKSYQGLQSCLGCVKSLTMQRRITRSASQGASYRWEPGIQANSATDKEDTHTRLSGPANRTHKHAKVEATIMEDGSPTSIPIWHNNSGKAKIVSLSDAKISSSGRETNMIPDNCSPINIHICNNDNNDINKHDSNMIINMEISRSSHQYYEVGTTPDTSRQHHCSSNNNNNNTNNNNHVIAADEDGNISRPYKEGDTATDNYIRKYENNGNNNPVNNNIVTTDPVSGIWSTTLNEKGTRTIISSHTHMKPHTDNAGNDKILNRTNHQYNLMETIIDTGTYTNNPSGHLYPDEHMRLISQTRAIRSSPSTNARHMLDTDLAEVSKWSGQGTTSVGRLGMSDRQRVETVWDLGGTSRLGLDSSNNLGKGWDPGPSWEAQNKPQEYKWRIAQEERHADGETANNQSLEENE